MSKLTSPTANVCAKSASHTSSHSTHSAPAPRTLKKPQEDQGSSLRQELRTLYDTLKDKNEQLAALEKDVRDRDVSIRYLKSEFKKLKDSMAQNKQRPNGAPNGSPKSKDAKDAKDANGESDDIINQLQRELKDRDTLIKDLNRKIMRLSDNLNWVQRESTQKDVRSNELQHEIDKFRQVVSQESLN